MTDYILFLDDERFPADALIATGEVVVCRSVREAKAAVSERGVPSLICFDHDLGEGEQTGHDFAKWLVDLLVDEYDPPRRINYTIHSQNPVGAENIKGTIENYHKWWIDGMTL